MRFIETTQGKKLTTDDKRHTSHDGHSTIAITVQVSLKNKQEGRDGPGSLT